MTENTTILIAHQEFEELGVILEVCEFEYVTELNGISDFQKIAIAGMEIFQERYYNSFRARNPDLNINNYFNIQINGVPRGKEISFEEFLGKGYNFRTDKIQLFDYGNNFRSGTTSEGFAYALLNPPYSVRLMESGKFSIEYGIEEQARMLILLKKYLKEILFIEDFKNTDHLEIYIWSDDWSNYFNAGKEWWGAFYWTIYNKQRNTVTVIGGSATD